MQAETAATVPRARSAEATRERILSAASELFYAQGIRATSADRIIEQVGITKVTFYRHFRTKSDLVVAYLGQQSAGERGWMEGLHEAGDAEATLTALAKGIGEASCSPGFRGCAFINAAAEFSDPADPVRAAVNAHRQWMLDEFAGIARDAGARKPEAVARQLLILRDGAMVNGYLGDQEWVADSLVAAFRSVISKA